MADLSGSGSDGETSAVGGSPSFAAPRKVSRLRQFAAVVHKNFILQTRASKAWYTFGATGWAALFLEISIPALFFALMCLPKYYLEPAHFPQELALPNSLDSTRWGTYYQGPAQLQRDFRALILFAPNNSEAQEVMTAFARSVACPEDPPPRGWPSRSSFYTLFRQVVVKDECVAQQACMSSPECTSHLLGTQIVGFSTPEEALAQATSRAETVDAVINLEGLDALSFNDIGYTLRVNHTQIPTTRARLDTLAVTPDDKYRQYWLFGNLQFHLDRAILGLAQDRGKGHPALIEADIKPFPWPAGTFDPGAVFAAVAFNLLLVFAFLVPTRSMIATIVREKELRLREGMRILGLQNGAYWGSWAISHFTTLGASMLLCALISLYPFRHSSSTLLLVILWLVAAALISFAYMLSTLFSKSRIAGIAGSMLYALAMVPGYIMPTFQPYGGWGWYLACLLPPSVVSLFANVLIKVESSGQGLQWGSLNESVTSESSFPFSSKVVLLALVIDIALYTLLTAYLDKVVPSEYGANLPWNFPFKRRTWSWTNRAEKREIPEASPEIAAEKFAADSDLAVYINNLKKVFQTTDGTSKAAVDGLSLEIFGDEITALLGANGAGKTTTISILTGMLKPTEGSAFVNGHSILEEMGTIRQSLGVCPQFDILWPDITVREHLELYAAIKGYESAAGRAAAVSAAEEVGLGPKLNSLAENLSGGQRRKLSVAIAFMGSPAIVILDEPTSGMDPYSKRFTWEIIKRHKAGHAIILTTHSMEEADLLCDRIAIMAEGRLAVVGSSLDLKRRFGVGYRLVIVRQKPGSESASLASGQDGQQLHPVSSQQSMSDLSEGDAEVDSLLSQHVRGVQLISRGASEMVFRLPKEESEKFPAMLRSLEAAKAQLGVSSYGLSETTLEEVFLAVTAKPGGEDADGVSPPSEEDAGGGEVSLAVDDETRPLIGKNGANGSNGDFQGDTRRPSRLQGMKLFGQQLWALLVKRAVSAKRDRLAVWTQLCVPVLLVLVALTSGRASSRFPQEPSLLINRQVCEFGAPTVFAASAEARANASAFESFVGGYGSPRPVDSGAEKVWRGPFLMPPDGTLDGYLLDTWGGGRARYDALLVTNWSNTPQILAPGEALRYTLLVNQSATHALPAALNSISSALLRAVTGNRSARVSVTNYPMPTLTHEDAIELSRATGDLLLVLFTVMASAQLSSSFAVFLVRERENSSKSVQLISGASISAFWLSNLLWDIISFTIPAAGIFICYTIFQLPQFRGERLGAFAVLLWFFGWASIPFTYLLHFPFSDEMKALQRINSVALLCGYIGFLATWILDLLFMLTSEDPRLKTAKDATRLSLRVLSPHFNLARGMYEVSRTHHESAAEADSSPWTWTATGQWVTFMALQAVVFGGLTLLIESGWLSLLGHAVQRLVTRLLQNYGRSRHGQELPQDEDVIREFYRIQDGGGERDGDQVILAQMEKSYGQGWRQPPIQAVQRVSVGINQGECFGLLGVNGAGKTTIFRILTGEVSADAGEATICGHSVITDLPAARRNIGYCPQFSALPGALTGREVLRMYARLRGVPRGLIEGSVQSLLERLDLVQYADRACDSYSGGNKRKLSVCVALVGNPPVVMLDEPSTGMDPGAKRFLWDILQKQVVERGHTVLLTSHSMEECEALCTKIAIMRSGQLRCLGSVQHLKNRFGAGYVLTLRLEHGREGEPVRAAVEGICPNPEVLQSAEGRMSIRLPQQGLDLPLLFEKMESSRQDLGIEEYSISQTTLEHVFVQLAEQQQ